MATKEAFHEFIAKVLKKLIIVSPDGPTICLAFYKTHKAVI